MRAGGLDGDCVNYAQVRQIEEMFQHRWDAMVLLCLADGPLRYGDLASAINKRSDKRIAEAVLTRCLRRLTERGLVGRPDDNTIAYTLTTVGQAQTNLLGKLSRAMRAADRARAR